MTTFTGKYFPKAIKEVHEVEWPLRERNEALERGRKAKDEEPLVAVHRGTAKRRRSRWSLRRKRRRRGGGGVLCARHARCAESPARPTSSTPQRRTVTTACQVWTSMSGPRRKRGVAAVAGPRARAGAGRHASISLHVCGAALVGSRNRPRAHASRVREVQGSSE